jgi:hypothetical protein
MAATETAQPAFRPSPENAAVPRQEHNCTRSVLSAYTTAMERSQNERSAFDAAVRTFLMHNASTPEAVARAAVARIISWKE